MNGSQLRVKSHQLSVSVGRAPHSESELSEVRFRSVVHSDDHLRRVPRVVRTTGDPHHLLDGKAYKEGQNVEVCPSRTRDVGTVRVDGFHNKAAVAEASVQENDLFETQRLCDAMNVYFRKPDHIPHFFARTF